MREGWVKKEASGVKLCWEVDAAKRTAFLFPEHHLHPLSVPLRSRCRLQMQAFALEYTE